MFALVLACSLLLALATPASAAPVRTAVRAKGATAKSAEVLPFIADDYPRAVALARARKVPLFIESWAPW